MKITKYTFCPTCIELIRIQNKDKYAYKCKYKNQTHFFCSEACMEKYKRKQRIMKDLKLEV